MGKLTTEQKYIKHLEDENKRLWRVINRLFPAEKTVDPKLLDELSLPHTGEPEITEDDITALVAGE